MDARAEPLLDRRQQVLIPLNLQIRVEAALHQDARSAQVQRLLNLAKDSLVRKDVALRAAHRTIKGAEAAILGAEICVIDIAIDDVADHALGMDPASNGVSRHSCADQIVGGEQVPGLFIRNHTAANSSGSRQPASRAYCK